MKVRGQGEERERRKGITRSPKREKEAEVAVETVLIACWSKGSQEEYRAKVDSAGKFVLREQREDSGSDGTIGRFL